MSRYTTKVSDCDKCVRHHAAVTKSYYPDVPYDEILQQAYVIAYEAAQTWDPNRAQLSTWIDRQLCGRLKRHLNREARYAKEFEEKHTNGLSDHQQPINPEHIVSFKNELENLSNDSKAIVEEVLEPGLSNRLNIETNASPKHIRGRLSQYMHTKDMAWNRIWSAFNELKALTT